MGCVEQSRDCVVIIFVDNLIHAIQELFQIQSCTIRLWLSGYKIKLISMKVWVGKKGKCMRLFAKNLNVYVPFFWVPFVPNYK